MAGQGRVVRVNGTCGRRVDVQRACTPVLIDGSAPVGSVQVEGRSVYLDSATVVNSSPATSVISGEFTICHRQGTRIADVYPAALARSRVAGYDNVCEIAGHFRSDEDTAAVTCNVPAGDLNALNRKIARSGNHGAIEASPVNDDVIRARPLERLSSVDGNQFAVSPVRHDDLSLPQPHRRSNPEVASRKRPAQRSRYHMSTPGSTGAYLVNRQAGGVARSGNRSATCIDHGRT